MTLFEYGETVSGRLRISNRGNSTIGSNAVTAMGTASVAHQIAISNPTAAVRHAASESSSGPPTTNIRIAIAGPRNKPMSW